MIMLLWFEPISDEKKQLDFTIMPINPAAHYYMNLTLVSGLQSTERNSTQMEPKRS